MSAAFRQWPKAPQDTPKLHATALRGFKQYHPVVVRVRPPEDGRERRSPSGRWRSGAPMSLE
eukprot:789103-Alexandrium_andersonii.AAC.1